MAAYYKEPAALLAQHNDSVSFHKVEALYRSISILGGITTTIENFGKAMTKRGYEYIYDDVQLCNVLWRRSRQSTHSSSNAAAAVHQRVP